VFGLFKTAITVWSDLKLVFKSPKAKAQQTGKDKNE
jgi:hypothetical protein